MIPFLSLKINSMNKAVIKYLCSSLAFLTLFAASLKAQPEWVPGTPSVVGVGPLTITLSYGLNSPGKIYIVVTDVGTANWPSSVVKQYASIPPSGNFVANAIISITEGDENSIFQVALDVFSVNRVHTVWLVGESLEGILQASPVSFQVRTLQCPSALPGSGGSACGLDFKLSATAPTYGTGTWTQTSGPGTSTFTPDATSPDATVTVTEYGTYTYTWTVVYRTCTTVSSPVSVVFYQQPAANAGSNSNICSTGSFSVFDASATSYSSLLWTHNGTGNLANAATLTPTYTPAATDGGKTVTLTLTAKNGTCPDAVSSMNIMVDAQTKADAGNDKTECGLESRLKAAPSIGKGTWSVISGPGNITFDPDANTPDPRIKADIYGVYTFRWTEVNGTCSSYDDVTVDFNENPSPVSAGDDQVVCGPSATMAGTAYNYLEAPNDHSGSTRTWSKISGPGTATFAAPDSPLSNVSVDTYGTYVFRWTETNGSCTVSDDVTVDFNEDPAGTSAGSGFSVCGPSGTMAAKPFIYAASPNDHTGSSALWTQVAGPGTASFTAPSDPASPVSVTVYGVYTFRWTETNGNCVRSGDVVVDFNENPSPVNAGSDQNICGSSTALTAAAYTYLTSPNDNSGSTGTWSKISGPGAAVFGSPASPSTTVSVDYFGVYTFRWTETNGNCAVYDDVVVDFNENPSPVSAGEDRSVCGASTALAAAAYNYRLPPNDNTGAARQWSQVSGPGTASFAAPSSPSSSVSVSIYGVYTFRWSETNGSCTVQDEVTIDFNENPSPISAGYSQMVCGTSANLSAQAFVYSASPNDNSGSTRSWSKLSGPGTSTFTSPGSPATTVTVSIYGVYIFRWTETNGSCINSGDVQVDFNEDPATINAGPDQSLCGLSATLAATPYTYLESPNDHTGSTGTWSKVSGPGTAVFTSAASPSSGVTVDIYGTYIFRWTETNGSCMRYDDMTADFNQIPETLSAGPDQSVCGPSATLAAVPFTYLGGLNDHSGSTRTWWQVSGPGASVFSDASSPTSAVTVNTFGSYTFRWTEINGNCMNQDEVTIDFNQNPSPLNAGPDQNVCGLSATMAAIPFSYAGSGNDNTGSARQWTKVSGPGTATFADPSSPGSAVSVTVYGVYTFRWTETNGTCLVSDEVIVDFNENPSSISAGGDRLVCGLTANMEGTAYTYLAAPNDNSGSTRSWSVMSATGAATFLNPGSPSSGVTVTAYGPYIFRWTETNGACTVSDEVTIDFNQDPVTINAGADQNICGTSTTIAASAFTYLPSPNDHSGSTRSWSQTSGPGTAVFITPGSPSTGVSVNIYGLYTFRWTEVNGNCIRYDELTVDFNENPSPLSAGPAQNICGLVTTMAAVPHAYLGSPNDHTGSTQSWSQVSGPATAVFSTPGSPNSVVTVTAYGTYTFLWTETNGPCSVSSPVTVNFYQQPVANAGSGGNECDLNFNLRAVPGVGAGTWTKTSGPGTATFAPNANTANAVVTVSAYGTYVFTWTETNGTCSGSASVTVNFYQQPVANPGQGGNECDLNFVLNAVPSVGAGTWTKTGGPGTAIFISAASSPTATVTVSEYGTYTFTWTEVNGTCSSSAPVNVNFYRQPVANAGTGGSECDLNFNLRAVPDIGTGTWTKTSGPGNATFAPGINSPEATVTVSAYGTYVFTWTEVNGTCSNSSSVTVNFYQQPVANAGSGGNECDLNFVFSAVPSAGIGTWTKTSGPGTATFAPDNHAPKGTVTVSAYGTYTFTWTEVNGTCSNSAVVTVNFYRQPVANAGAGGNECDLNYNFKAVASIGAGTWTKTTGPGDAVFTPNANTPAATVTVSAYGTYTFTWTEVNGTCSNSSVITVNFYRQPVANAGTGGNNCGNEFYLKAVPSAGTGTWTKAAGPGNVTFTPNANAPNAVAKVSLFGSYTFTWTEVNGTCSNSAQVTVNFVQVPAADAGSGGLECDLDFKLNARPGIGTGTWSKFSGPGNAVFRPNAGDPAATVTVDEFGDYEFIWTEVSISCSSSDIVTVSFHDLPEVDAGQDIDLCEGDSIQLNASGTGTFLWSPAASMNDPAIPDPKVSPVTSTMYKVLLTDQFGCKNTDSVKVEIWKHPHADAGPDQKLEYRFETNLAAKLGENETGVWSIISGSGQFDNTTDPLSGYKGLYLGMNKLKWTVTNGVCPSSSDEVNIVVHDLVIPTLVTPNMDGKNDYFELRGIETFVKTEIVIFNRRGVEIYKNSNYKNDWNGVDNNGQPVPDDTYFYVVIPQKGEPFNGFIVIRR
jgi:gliding motility-associated-like protein